MRAPFLEGRLYQLCTDSLWLVCVHMAPACQMRADKILECEFVLGFPPCVCAQTNKCVNWASRAMDDDESRRHRTHAVCWYRCSRQDASWSHCFLPGWGLLGGSTWMIEMLLVFTTVDERIAKWEFLNIVGPCGWKRKTYEQTSATIFVDPHLEKHPLCDSNCWVWVCFHSWSSRPIGAQVPI